jgi:zinc protease
VSGVAVDRSAPPPPGPIRPFVLPGLDRGRMGGVGLVAARVPGTRVVSAALVSAGGAAGEAPGEAGISALAADLLDAGTDGRSGHELAAAMEGLGAEFSAHAGWDSMQVVVTALEDRIAEALALVGEMVRDPAVPTEELERARAARLSAVAQRRADPRSLANEVTRRLLYVTCGRAAMDLGGIEETVQHLDREAVIARLRGTVGRPHHVVLAGAVGEDAGAGIVGTALEGLPEPPAPPPPVEVTDDAAGVRIVVVDRPRGAQAEVRVGQLGVARDTPDYFPLMVMNTVLGGYFNSRLNQNLRERRGLTYGCSSGFGMHRYRGTFVVSTAVQTDAAGQAVGEIVREIAALCEGSIGNAELEDARSYRAGVYPLSFQRTEGVAAHLAELALYGLPDDHIARYAERILAVTAAEAEEAARRHLHPDRLTVVVAAPAAEVRPQLEALDLGTVDVVDAAVLLDTISRTGCADV